jgi:hypothetical protein
MSSQVAGDYSIDINNDLTCEISLANDFRYILFLSSIPPPGSDVVYNYLLSFGKYTLKNNQVELTDNNGIISIKGTKTGNNLIFNEGFKFIKNKTITFISPVSDPSLIEFYFTEYGHFKVKYEYDIFLIPHILNFGTFYIKDDQKIVFYKNKTYKYFFKSLLLSSGTWEKNNNTLVCKDSFLLKSLNIYILNNYTIEASLLPHESEGSVFKLEK